MHHSLLFFMNLGYMRSLSVPNSKIPVLVRSKYNTLFFGRSLCKDKNCHSSRLIHYGLIILPVCKVLLARFMGRPERQSALSFCYVNLVIEMVEKTEMLLSTALVFRTFVAPPRSETMRRNTSWRCS